MNKQKKGPFTIDELSSERISINTKVRHSGLSKWEKASSLPELQDILTNQPPVMHHKRNIFIGASVAFIVITLCQAWNKNLFSFSKNNSDSTIKESSFNNQQLYNLYSPGVVLIQHKYIYEIAIGSKKYYFNDFWNYESFYYLTGLTESRADAEAEANPIQGTGFFISNDGKILTNRHVALGNPGSAEQQYIRNAFIATVTSSNEQKLRIDTLMSNKAQYDSTLFRLLEDSTYNAMSIAEIKEKLSGIQNILDEEDANGEGTENINIDANTLDLINNNQMTIRKITLDLKVYTSGVKDLDNGGIQCKIFSTSNDRNVDLAIIQTENQKLPDPSIKLLQLSRIKSKNADSIMPKMSERLILIGYNMGTGLSATNDGIKSQLTDGKVSQNTDEYKLLYTIPTLEGSSGSPVLDEKGRLVSVNFAGINQTQNFNYGIHPKKIQEFLKRNNVL